MKPWTIAPALVLAMLGSAHALTLGDLFGLPHQEPAKRAPAVRPAATKPRLAIVHAGPPPARVPPHAVETPRERSVVVSSRGEIKPSVESPETTGSVPAGPAVPAAPPGPLVLPDSFAPQPMHLLRPGEPTRALKPWPYAARSASFSPPPELAPFSLPALASLSPDVPSPPKVGPPITIKWDDGGWLQDYYLRFRDQVQKGATYRIDGRCASACTLVLIYPDRVCVTKRAVLGFHEARNRNGTRNQRVTDNMMAVYPEPVREYILAHGGLPAPSSMMWVSGAALRNLVQPCE